MRGRIPYGWRKASHSLATIGLAVAIGVVAMPVTACAATLNSAAEVRDPFVPNDPLLDEQWHVTPSGSEPDIKVQAAWDRGLTGAGVTIGIVDLGLQWDHPDLVENYNAAASYDFVDRDSDPRPTDPDEYHGTAVAGLAAARGGNGIGVSGVAPHASLAGLRIHLGWDGGLQTTAEATRYLSTGPDRSIDIKNHSYSWSDYPATWHQSRIDARNAIRESASEGTIHVVGAGNFRGRTGSGDANKSLLTPLPEAITVAAIDPDGVYARYSNYGANVFVTAPTGMSSTDLAGSDGQRLSDYTYFNGTSASTPIVAGALALAKEANPRLDGRMAKHLLALTSNNAIDPLDSSDESDGGWRTNAAGYRFNQNYGFGLLDVDALTRAAEVYFGVTDLHEETTGLRFIYQDVPRAVVHDEVPGILTEKFVIEGQAPLEEMLVMLDVRSGNEQELQATLTSPSGTSSRLMRRTDRGGGSRDTVGWTYASNAFWGEDPSGEWTLTVEDWYYLDTNYWRSFSATALMGRLITVPEPSSALLMTFVIACWTCGRRR